MKSTITDRWKIVLAQFRTSGDLRPARLVSTVVEQLRAQGRDKTSPYRYSVRVEIREGGTRPATDLDNYAKPMIDAVPRSQLLWKDDDQIDELLIRRRRDGRCMESHATLMATRITGQHRGIPTHLRARCAEARRGLISYTDLGYDLAGCLKHEAPYDLEDEAWLDEISRLSSLIEADRRDEVWIWLHEHFPKFMDLVPNRRKRGFLSGLVKAYDDGRLNE